MVPCSVRIVKYIAPKANKKHGSRQETHPLSDRPAIDWPCSTDYDATISFGLLFEPEDCQYGKSRLIPLARAQTPEEIGILVAFLACDDASSISGQSIHIDGGQRMA